MVAQKEGTDRQVIVVGICLGGYLFYATDRCMKLYSRIPSNGESKKVSQDTNVPEKRYNLRPRKGDDKKGDDKKGDDKKVVTMKNQNTVYEIRPSTYLNVLVDFIRNLTNGMALAASFYISPAAGLVTTIAVFFYKVSLDISDFIKAGSAKTGALRAQFINMVGTCIGTFVGVALFQVARQLEKSRGEDSRGLFGTTVGWDDAIISAIIGKFIYIVTVGIMVEMPSTKSKERIQSIKEVLSLAFGLHLVMLVSWNEGRQKYE
jgi:zinc transporter 7